MLVNGTKEKNSAVKSSSESALVAFLHLRDAEDKSGQQKCLEVLDTGARDALNDVIVKVSDTAMLVIFFSSSLCHLITINQLEIIMAVLGFLWGRVVLTVCCCTT